MEEEEDKKPAAKDRATQPQKTKLQGHIVSSREVNLFAKKAGDNDDITQCTTIEQQNKTMANHYKLR